MKIDREIMCDLYESIRTPFKHGIVLRGDRDGEMLDSPSVFRHCDTWFMVYISFDGDGYETHLAQSDNLFDWMPLGVILPRSPGAWDNRQCAGYIALQDSDWNGEWTLTQYDGRYWMSYLGGALGGYETDPLSIGIAWTDDPGRPAPWQKLNHPVLRPDDAGSRPWERNTLFKSNIIYAGAMISGYPFIMHYNSNAESHGKESIGMAGSYDMRVWTRLGDTPAIDHGTGISGDPQVVKIGNYWVMMYFGAFWGGSKGGFNTFAASRDLRQWTRWDGPPLVAPSEPWDKEHAHKPWVIRHAGTTYHFYCAVGEGGRSIALATS